jgi:glycosyltransferase involved in cell wall biosynthesis
MFNNPPKLKGLFTYENYQGVEYFWMWCPPYNPQNITRFIAMAFFAVGVLLLPLYRSKLGQPDSIVLSSMSIFPVPSVLLLKRLLSARRFVFEVRDLWPLTPIYLKNISRWNPLIVTISWLERIAYRQSDAIISLFEEAGSYINRISKAPEKFNWIPNGIDFSLLDVNKETRLLENWKRDKTKRVVCYAGTMGFANALDPFFEFIGDPEMDNVTTQYNFLIVGDGYLKEKYESLVDHRMNVTFLGKVPKSSVQAILSHVNICFISWHTSKLYSYGVSANKYFDYMAASKPILSAQKGIVDPVVKSGCGIVVENTKDKIAEGLNRMLSLSDSELQSLGKKGSNYVVQHHLYNQLGSRFFEILKGK